MRIVDLLQPSRILLRASAEDQTAVQNQLVDLQMLSGAISNRDEYLEAIRAREAQGSTAIEAGNAVPHAKSQCVSAPCL